MIHGGLVSITFRNRTAGEVIDLVRRSGLTGIEWGGDVHVPHGRVDVARQVAKQTADAGLSVAAYGSYYRAGVSEAAGLPFGDVLDSAVALGAPRIRVWAGDCSPSDADDAWRAAVAADALRIADLAASAGVEIAFEYHGRTLTETDASARRFLFEEAAHANITAYWQPNLPTAENLPGLRHILPILSNLHVFHWNRTDAGWDRRPLVEGACDWAGWWEAVRSTGRDHYALIEFVRDDAPEQFLTDAQTLQNWLNL